MKVLILSTYPAPYRVSLFEKLAEKWDLSVFFERENIDRDPRYCAKSETLRYFVLGTKESDRAFSEAKKHLKDFDLVMFFEYATYLSAKMILNCIRKRVSYAINCDGAVDISMKFPKKQIKDYFIRHAALCLAGGERAKEYFLAYGAKAENIAIYHFTSIYQSDIAAPVSPEKKRILREKEGLIGDRCCVSVGQFIPRKRFDLLLDVWERMPSDVSLYMIGSGAEKERLCAAVRDKGLGNVFVLDFLPREELFSLYPLFDLFLFPTREDIWGLVINEAMAKGLPVISTDRCTAAVEMVREGENGYIVPEGERSEMVRGFAEYAMQLLRDSEKQIAFSQKAVSVAEGYTYEIMAERVVRAAEEKSGF